jgi:hypothetical protein
MAKKKLESVSVVGYWPAISGCFKTTAEGGARVTFELDPLAAMKVYPFYLGTTVQGQEETFEIKLTRR